MDATGACNSRGTRETGREGGGLRYEGHLDNKKKKERKKEGNKKEKKCLTPGIVPTSFWV